MASTAGRQVAGVGANSNPVEPQMWSYAVPMDEENGDPSQTNDYDGSYDGRLYNSASKSKLRSKSSQPSAQGSNGLSNRYSADQGTAEDAYDELESHRSLSATRSRGASKERLRVKKKTSKGAVAAITEEDDKWIHRDKLMQIESRELKEMTSRYSKGSRATSRAGKSTRTSVADGDLDPEDAQELQKSGSSRRQHHADFQDVDEEPDDNSPAGPDELMGEELIENSDGHTHSHSRRPSGSRIPVSKNASAVGSPSDRELASSPPSKTANGLTKSRSRSNSLKGQNSQEGRRPSASSPQSPKEGQGQTGRKGSNTKKSPASGQRENANESPKRPRTRDGNVGAPADPMEADPPWMSSMYKPDPRLPPDQQMLPTHARRLAREREEAARLGKENRPPDDEDYQAMSDESPNRNRSGSNAQSTRPAPDLSEHPAYRDDPDRSQWPLRSQDQSLQNSPTRKDIEEGAQHASPGSGNYNLMPTVSTTREGQHGASSPRPSQKSPNTEKPLPSPNAPVARLPEMKEEEEGKKEKKGACAGCCVVM